AGPAASGTAASGTGAAGPDAPPTASPAASPAPTAPAQGAASRFAALAGFCEGVAAPDRRERASRRERARALLHDAGFAALIIEAGTSLYYFTGVRWRPSERPLLCVLPARGEPVWIAPAFEEGTLRQRE